MSSRQEQKAQLRREREEREQAEKAAAARKKRMVLMGAGAVLLVAIVAAVAVVALGGGDSKSSKTVGGVDPLGLQISPGPWPPEYSKLPQRLKALGLPDPSDQVYHVHSQISVYVDGKKQEVPAQIGIDSQHQILASLHTHDASGVVHQEAVQPYPFTLGEFFKVWGVKFTATQLGAYHSGKGLVLQTWVNGKLVPDGPSYKMKSHDLIVVGFGDPGSFPTTSKFKFPAGE